jgi:hypothetical protein
MEKKKSKVGKKKIKLIFEKKNEKIQKKKR